MAENTVLSKLMENQPDKAELFSYLAWWCDLDPRCRKASSAQRRRLQQLTGLWGPYS